MARAPIIESTTTATRRSAYVVVDPDHAVLVDQNFLNNHGATSAAHPAGAPRTFERAFFWAESLLLGVSP